jgi:hypothetical protein
MTRFRLLSASLVAAVLALGASRAGATTVIGDLNNFDTVNDTGQTCYGFEIEIEDVRSTDVTYTFDWNHYGVPKILEDTTNPLHPKVLVRYESTKNLDGTFGANGSFTNQVIPSITPPQGHTCTDTSVNEGCEHFGVGYYGTPTVVRYRWLVDGGGTLVPAGQPVGVGTPTWNYTPPAVAQPAQIAAVIPAPAVPNPAGKEFGEPVWVKVIKTTTHAPHDIALAALISDDTDADGLADWTNGEPDEVETEWKLLQKNAGANAAKDELAGAAEDLADPAENVTRRYEFYQYAAAADTIDGETGEAMCDEVDPTTDPADPAYLHGKGTSVTVTDANGDSYTVDCAAQVVVGNYIGAQMAGFDVAAPLGLIDNLQDADTSAAYTPRTVVVGGDSPFAITVSDGSLPAGMVLDDWVDPTSGVVSPGVLSGTPTVPGDYAFTVTATDAQHATVSRAYVLHVAGGVVDTSTSTTTTTTTTTSTTTTTTLPPPSCTMGAGIPQPAPKPPKNAGLVKIAKGLTATPATGTTKLKISGTLENCQNFPAIPGASGPITAGAFKLTLEIPPGSSCAGLAAGAPVKSVLSITWSTPDPVHPGRLRKVGSEKTTLANYGQPGTDPIVLDVASQDFGVTSKTPGFATSHAVLSMTMDQTAAAIAAACADPRKGLAVLNFTGVNGASTLEIR